MEFKWYMIGITVIMVAALVAAAVSEQTKADRISACISAENMQYINNNCVPIKQ